MMSLVKLRLGSFRTYGAPGGSMARLFTAHSFLIPSLDSTSDACMHVAKLQAWVNERAQVLGLNATLPPAH